MLYSGPFKLAIQSQLTDVAYAIHTLYADHACASAKERFADFHVSMDRAEGLRGWIKPQINFRFDGQSPFKPLPRPQAYAMLEWGLNWCIANFCHQYLMIHAAVIERNGFAAILPAPPGSGKSTLCAALIHRGWRLCSDELTLINPDQRTITALARPVNLKNRSIDIIQKFAPQAEFGPATPDTLKGTVIHMRAPRESIERVAETAIPRWIVFPQWQADAPAQLTAQSKSFAFIQLAENAFNYSVLGEPGFHALGDVIDQSECLSFTYSKLDDAIETFERLAQGAKQ